MSGHGDDGDGHQIERAAPAGSKSESAQLKVCTTRHGGREGAVEITVSAACRLTLSTTLVARNNDLAHVRELWTTPVAASFRARGRALDGRATKRLLKALREMTREQRRGPISTRSSPAYGWRRGGAQEYFGVTPTSRAGPRPLLVAAGADAIGARMIDRVALAGDASAIARSASPTRAHTRHAAVAPPARGARLKRGVRSRLTSSATACARHEPCAEDRGVPASTALVRVPYLSRRRRRGVGLHNYTADTARWTADGSVGGTAAGPARERRGLKSRRAHGWSTAADGQDIDS